MRKILVIRGGGLGDFIVTLPTLRLLRERWPAAHIELLGHPRIGEVALDRGYLQAIRSVNHGPLSAFFTPRAVLDPAWMDYIGSFDLVASYFFDPDGLFRTNLTRCQPADIITHPPRVPDTFARPAARYFAGLLQPLSLELGEDAASDLHLTAGDRDDAAAFLAGLPPGTRLVTIHPGSGSEKKNWPAAHWAELGRRLARSDESLTFVLVEGEADHAPAQLLADAWQELPLLRARWLPLPVLAAIFQRTALYLGHDSGVSHLAAAANRSLPMVSLFGPTNPAVWAPPRPGVQVLQGALGLASLTVDAVFAAAQAALAITPRS